jgi:hypothetical protein
MRIALFRDEDPYLPAQPATRQIMYLEAVPKRGFAHRRFEKDVWAYHTFFRAKPAGVVHVGVGHAVDLGHYVSAGFSANATGNMHTAWLDFPKYIVIWITGSCGENETKLIMYVTTAVPLQSLRVVSTVLPWRPVGFDFLDPNHGLVDYYE